MKLAIREHSRSTKASDLLLAVFSVAYFVLGLCFAQDLFACVIFLFSVICYHGKRKNSDCRRNRERKPATPLQHTQKYVFSHQ